MISFHFNRTALLIEHTYRCAGSHSFCETNTAPIWRNVQTQACSLHISEAILQQPDPDNSTDEPPCEPLYLTFGFSSDISVRFVFGGSEQTDTGLQPSSCRLLSNVLLADAYARWTAVTNKRLVGESHVVCPSRERGLGYAHACRILNHAHRRNREQFFSEHQNECLKLLYLGNQLNMSVFSLCEYLKINDI